MVELLKVSELQLR